MRVISDKSSNWVQEQVQTQHNHWIFHNQEKIKILAVNYFFSLWLWCNYFGAAEMHPCSTVVSGRKWRRKLFPIEAAGPILIVIIWGWVSSLDVIICRQTKKMKFMKNETCNDPQWSDPSNGSHPEIQISLLQKISFGGISSDLLWRKKFHLEVL